MKIAMRVILALVFLFAVFYGAILVASETGGEVVVLRTQEANGQWVSTRLWVTDDGGSEWLRAGDSSSGWFTRLRAKPRVEVERGGQLRSYRAVPVPTPGARDRINSLMGEKYGLADRLIDLVRDPSSCIAVRLDPAAPAS